MRTYDWVKNVCVYMGAVDFRTQRQDALLLKLSVTVSVTEIHYN